jgi:GMP synthase-like glutamine amidotransferase
VIGPVYNARGNCPKVYDTDLMQDGGHIRGWFVDDAQLLDGVAGVVILGGPMNVYEEDNYPFLALEDAFIKMVLREKIPFLGICLGAQLLAKACGAKVTKSDYKEIGWFEVDLTPEGKQDGLFRGLPHTIPVFQWHEDTFAVPDGGILLGTSALCRNQAFRVGDSAYGLQFHTEVTPDMVKAWAEKEGPNVDAKQIEEDGARLHTLFGKQARVIFTNFQRLLSSSAESRRQRDFS